MAKAQFDCPVFLGAFVVPVAVVHFCEVSHRYHTVLAVAFVRCWVSPVHGLIAFPCLAYPRDASMRAGGGGKGCRAGVQSLSVPSTNT